MKGFITYHLSVLLSVFILCNSQSVAQSRKIDSLLILIHKDKEDSNKVSHLNALGWQVKESDPDTAIALSEQALHLAKKIKWLRGEANSLGNLGTFYSIIGDLTKAQNYSRAALKIDEALNDQNGIAARLSNIATTYYFLSEYSKAIDFYSRALAIEEQLLDKAKQNGKTEEVRLRRTRMARNTSNLGQVNKSQGDFVTALEYFFRALKIDEAEGSRNETAYDFTNIGIVYDAQGDHEKALDYYNKSLKVYEELGDKNGVAISLGNIGATYCEQSTRITDPKTRLALLSKGLEVSLRALKLREELGAKHLISTTLGNIGNIYYDQGKMYDEGPEKDKLFALALQYYGRALAISKEMNDKATAASWLGNMAVLYTDIKKYALAESALIEALKIDTEIGAKNGIRQDEISLSSLYEKSGRAKEALQHYRRAMELQDSLFNEEKNNEITRKELNYEFEKKQAQEKSEHDKQLAVAEADKKQQRLLLWFTITGLGVTMLVALVVFRSLRLARRQKSIIEKQKVVVEKQKNLVDEKQKEILDSIHYAKRIQQALITNEKYIERSLSSMNREENSRA
jgi:tetratricopeptide (TPR) repeat protein